MIQADYGITVKSITSRNTQANSILEWVHQTISHIIRTFKVQDMVSDDENSWDRILASTMFALRATVHTAMPSIFNTRHEANWHLIEKLKQDSINKGNQRTNRNWKEQTYNKEDKVLL